MQRLIVLLLLGALLSSAALADERILSWHSEIRINPDSTMDVVETLRVRAEGRNIRRGIYREFPTVYTDRRGQRVVTGFDLVEVQRDGRAEPHHGEKRSNGLKSFRRRRLSPGRALRSNKGRLWKYKQTQRCRVG